VLENTSEQLVGNSGVAQRKVNNVDVEGPSIVSELWISQLCCHVKTEAVSRSDLFVANFDAPLAAPLDADQPGQA